MTGSNARYPRGAESTIELGPAPLEVLLRRSAAPSRPAGSGILDMKDDEHLRKAYLAPALNAGWIEMADPEKPTIGRRRYRPGPKGTERAGRVGGAP